MSLHRVSCSSCHVDFGIRFTQNLYLQCRIKEDMCVCSVSCSVFSTLRNPMDCSPPGSLVQGMSQARILEWVAMSFSRGSSQPRDWTCISCIAGIHFSLSCIGEGNSSPLQCSCLENPRDGGAWWAAVYGVAQSQTRLKQLSSSSSSTQQ